MNYIINTITSTSNPKIKEVLDIKNRRSKYRHSAFIIEGPHLVEMAILSGCKIKEVFFTHTFASKKEGQKLLRQISLSTPHLPPSKRGAKEGKQGIAEFSGEMFEVTENILRRLADTETPQGIIAIISYTLKNLTEISFRSVPLLVVLDGIQEPGNLGTMIRTADSAGADAVIILKGTCDPFMQKTLRATAGSIFNIPIVYARTEELLEWLKTKKIRLTATAVDSKISLFDADLKTGIAFVFGNEAHGISREIHKNADLLLKIPIFGKAESLNVSASAAICLYEAVRQRTSVSF